MRRLDSIKKHAVSLLGCSVFTLLCSGAQATVFQAEDYSAYHDASVGNQGRHYRYDNVDI